jgi:putative chitinase
MTPQQIATATGATLATAQAWTDAINAACVRFEINTPLRQAAFLSQIGVESARLTALVENLNYSEQALLAIWPDHFTAAEAAEFGRTATHPANQEAIANLAYGGRMGNTEPGDGWAYRGRGLIMLTGRANYRAAGLALGLPLETYPDRAALPNEAALTAAWYWQQHGCNVMADNMLIVAITQAINGGLNGLDKRQELFALAVPELTTA